MSFLPNPEQLLSAENIWVAIGLLGQALFGARFIIQWIMSERVGRSIIPLPFWFCSLGGGVVLLLRRKNAKTAPGAAWARFCFALVVVAVP